MTHGRVSCPVFDVEDGDQMRALEVHAMRDAAQFDLLVSQNELEGDLAAAVGEGVIDFPEPAAAGRPLNGVPIERAVAVLVLEAPVSGSCLGDAHGLPHCFPECISISGMGGSPVYFSTLQRLLWKHRNHGRAARATFINSFVRHHKTDRPDANVSPRREYPPALALVGRRSELLLSFGASACHDWAEGSRPGRDRRISRARSIQGQSGFRDRRESLAARRRAGDGAGQIEHGRPAGGAGPAESHAAARAQVDLVAADQQLAGRRLVVHQYRLARLQEIIVFGPRDADGRHPRAGEQRDIGRG